LFVLLHDLDNGILFLCGLSLRSLRPEFLLVLIRDLYNGLRVSLRPLRPKFFVILSF
jgi:hypothetical protein